MDEAVGPGQFCECENNTLLVECMESNRRGRNTLRMYEVQIQDLKQAIADCNAQGNRVLSELVHQKKLLETYTRYGQQLEHRLNAQDEPVNDVGMRCGAKTKKGTSCNLRASTCQYHNKK